MVRKFLAMAAVVSMVAGLTACGSGSKTTETSAKESAVVEADAPAGEASENYKIGLMISPLATREEYYRTAELLVEQYGSDKFIMDVFPEDPQNEQEVTISKALNIAMDPDVKAIIFDNADIGTIAAVTKIKEIGRAHV